MTDNPFMSMFSNPDFKRFASEGLQDFGYGLANSTNFGNAFGAATNRMAQMQPVREQQQMQLAQEEQAAKSKNATMEWLRTKGYDDLVAGVEGGGLDMQTAWGEALRRGQPQSPDPFTLGAGQVRYDGLGNVIAQGPEAGPGTVINNNMGGTDEFYGQLDKNLATQTTDLIGAGMSAQSNNIRLGELENLLSTAPQGAAGSFAQMASSLGIPVEGADEVQAAQALINQMVPGQRPPGSGTMSDADLALFKASLPQIINQPGGNQMILTTMKAINEYTVEQAKIAQAVANRQISPADGRTLAAQVPNPLEGIRRSTVAPSAADPLGIR